MNHNEIIKNLYVITGATATGKSSLAIKLAKHLGASIINGDSRQVYNSLTIGAAQPTPDVIKNDGTWIINDIEHYLYGHREIQIEYSVAEYQQEVFELLKTHPNKKFIIVGGSGLFIDSVIYNYKFNKNLPTENRDKLIQLNTETLQKLIPEKSLNQLNESDKANPARLIRVIERGIPKKQFRTSFKNYFLLKLSREKLLNRINTRTDYMFKNGLLDEVTELWGKYPNFDYKSLKSIGYQEFIPYFNNEIDLKEVKELINIHTRQYAKRQNTWFKKNTDCKRVTTIKDITALL